MSVEAVALKLPTFWTSCPSAWFVQTEAQFAIRGITADDTKYFHVVAALDATTATRALSILSSPPPNCKYDNLKSFLTGAFELSEAEKAATLLDMKDLGDNKPTEIMDKMLALLGDHRPCFLFRHIFLRLLPESIRAPLSNSPNISDYRALAKEADNLYNSLTPSMRLCSTTQPTDQLQTMPIPANIPDVDAICWFHRKFGSNARRCSSPCKHFNNFKTKKHQGNGRAGQQ